MDIVLVHILICTIIELYMCINRIENNRIIYNIKRSVVPKQTLTHQKQWKNNYYGNPQDSYSTNNNNSSGSNNSSSNSSNSCNSEVTCMAHSEFYESVVNNIHQLSNRSGNRSSSSDSGNGNGSGYLVRDRDVDNQHTHQQHTSNTQDIQYTHPLSISHTELVISYNQWSECIVLGTQSSLVQPFTNLRDIYKKSYIVELGCNSNSNGSGSYSNSSTSGNGGSKGFYLTNAMDVFIYRWCTLYGDIGTDMGSNIGTDIGNGGTGIGNGGTGIGNGGTGIGNGIGNGGTNSGTNSGTGGTGSTVGGGGAKW